MDMHNRIPNLSDMSGIEICKMAAKGNKDAEAFCVAWVEACHLWDDIADKDKPITDEQLSDTFVRYTLELCGNPFFLTNRAMLVPLMVQSHNLWCESNRTGAYSRSTRDVMKAHYHSVIWQVAFLVGGWSWMRKVTSECESFDFEKAINGTVQHT